MDDDYGYFGKGLEGYAHYMQAFERNFGKGGGGGGGNSGGGCGSTVVGTLVVLVILGLIGSCAGC